MNPLLASSQLYGILDTGYVAPSAMGAMTQQLLSGGIRLLQLRAKHSSEEEIIAMGRAVLPLIHAAGGLLIINDHPHLVPRIGADGAHIGQDDISVTEARGLAGEGAIIGLSTHSLEQVAQAIPQQPDYIGFGPLFTTPTKPDYKAIGLEDILKAQDMVTFPLFCIGGITPQTLPRVLAAGARQWVMVSSLLLAEDPAAMARTCIEVKD